MQHIFETSRITVATTTLLALLAILLGPVIALDPHAALAVSEVATLGIAIIVLRYSLTGAQRTLLAGLAIGVGQLTEHLGTASTGIFVVAIAAATPRTTRGWTVTKIGWAFGCLLVIGGISLTAQSANVPRSVLLNTAVALWASRWMFAETSPAEGWARAAGLDLVQTAGFVAGTLVIISHLIGHGLVPTDASMTHDALVTGGTTRASGPFTSPNEAGMILSAAVLATLLRAAFDPTIRLTSRWNSACLTCALVGLLLTGSRASVLACAGAGIVLAFSQLARRPKLVASLAVITTVAVVIGAAAGTFTGRGLNPLESNDASSLYRRQITQHLLTRLDWTQLRGFGFRIGNELANNPVSGSLPNIDNAWIYLLLTLGALSVAGFALIAIAASTRSISRRGITGLVALVWLAIVSPTENLFLLPGPCVCAMLLLTCTSTQT
jgi:hypothetical protein